MKKWYDGHHHGELLLESCLHQLNNGTQLIAFHQFQNGNPSSSDLLILHTSRLKGSIYYLTAINQKRSKSGGNRNGE